MTPADHIHGSLTAALAHSLAGNHARAAAFVIIAAAPALAGRIGWSGLQVVASQWLSNATGNMLTSGNAEATFKDPPRTG